MKSSPRSLAFFPYTKLRSIDPFTGDTSHIYRPLIPVDIGYKKKWLSIACKRADPVLNGFADSGSDRTLADISVARILKIPLEKCDPIPIVGISGNSVEAYFHGVELRIGSKKYTSRIGFVEDFRVDVLLGAEGFFDQFEVILDYPNSIEVREKKVPPHS